MPEEKEENEPEDTDDLDDELEKQWALQGQIHHKCKMRDDPEVKQKNWNEKHGNSSKKER